MTTHELRKIREEMQQSPRSMADHLGINVQTYYLWERGRPIPQHFALAVRFLATQDLPKDPSLRRRSADALLTKFAPGSRFGRLVVVAFAPHTGGSRHRRVKVQCDCGEQRVMRTSTVAEAVECSYYCPLKGRPLPAPEAAALTSALAPAEETLFMPSPPDPDEPSLDESDAVWRVYNDRKAKEREAELRAAAGQLNDEAAPGDDLPALDEDWEEGLA